MRIEKIKNVFPKITSKIKSVLKVKSPQIKPQPASDSFEPQTVVLRDVKSKIIEKLYSPEFYPKRSVDEVGCRITTIIDRETKKPVEAFVVAVQRDNNPLHESWAMLMKDNKGKLELPNGEKARIIGEIHYFQNPLENMITPSFEKIKKNGEIYEKVGSYMVAKERDKYQGIGFRLHQIRIERMFGAGFKNVQIVADGNSFLFHYNLGFRIEPTYKPLGNEEYILKYLSQLNNKTIEENSKYLRYGIDNRGQHAIDFSKTLENMLLEHYSHSNKKLDVSPNMVLTDRAKAEWFQLIKSQPITLDIK